MLIHEIYMSFAELGHLQKLGHFEKILATELHTIGKLKNFGIQA